MVQTITILVFMKYSEIFLNLDNDYFILCGDFNLAFNPLLDTENYNQGIKFLTDEGFTITRLL